MILFLEFSMKKCYESFVGNKETSDKKPSLEWIVKTRPGVTAKIYQKLNLSSEKREETFHKTQHLVFLDSFLSIVYPKNKIFLCISIYHSAVQRRDKERKKHNSLNLLVVHLNFNWRLYSLVNIIIAICKMLQILLKNQRSKFSLKINRSRH